MAYRNILLSEEKAFELDVFREMDYFAVKNYALPIELMMENAGLHLARLIADFSKKSQTIKIGIGNGNNGGGGLVAARRLAAWGYDVYIDLFTDISRYLPKTQLERALKFGVKTEGINHPDVWVDAYLGFSQTLPLNSDLEQRITAANGRSSLKISLDIPTGFLGDSTVSYFKADKVLTLAAAKKILYRLAVETDIFIADLGIPKSVYRQFGSDDYPFDDNTILKIQR